MYEELTPNKANFGSPQTKTADDVINGPPPPAVLRTELEKELRSGSKEIRSNAWFHGKIPRDVAEEQMRKDGDFLIRESISNIGEYVLTCKYRSAYYHFKINKTVEQKSPTYAVVQYCLEGHTFESLPALVYCYVGEKLPVSKKTGVVLGQPVNRAIPISYSDVKYASLRRQPKGKATGGSMKQYNNNNNVSTVDKGANSNNTWQNSASTSLSSSPSSSVSSMESHDKSRLTPRTPSPQANSIYSTPRSPATPFSPHQRKTSDPLPHLPDPEAAVVMEERLIPNSYSQTGGKLQISSPRPVYTPPPSSPGYANTKPFPLTLLEDSPRPRQEATKLSTRTRLHSSGSQDHHIEIVNPAINRPASQVDLNIESHGKYVSRSGSDPILSPTRTRSGLNPSSPRPHNANSNNNSSFTFQMNSDGTGSAIEQHKAVKTVPPKPSRVPSFRTPVIKGSKQTSNNSLSNRMGSVKNSVALLADKRATPPTIAEVAETPVTSPERNVNMRSKPPRSSKSRDMAARKRKRASCFKPMQYQCTMLSPENPPLEQKALTELRVMLLTVDPFKLARHMTVIDCKICRVMEGDLQHMLLPHASQLRQDILERYQCIAFWVAICVIKCANGKEERADILNMFIQVANELVHSMGNVFGFSAIMHGLTCPQISSLDSSWDSLRRRFTNNAVTFEKKLRPLLRFLDEGKGQIRLTTTCIPHIMPLIRLLENTGTGVPHTGNIAGESMTKKSTSFGSLLDRTSPSGSLGRDDTSSLNSTGRETTKVDWWENQPNESFDSLLSHLNSGRSLLENIEELRKNANSKLVDFKEIAKIREMFTTDFQMRLLFGYRSAESPRYDRFHKFDRIISAMLRHITA